MQDKMDEMAKHIESRRKEAPKNPSFKKIDNRASTDLENQGRESDEEEKEEQSLQVAEGKEDWAPMLNER